LFDELGQMTISVHRPAPRVCAVIVAYKPVIALLERALAATAPQVASLLLISNDDHELPLSRPPGNVSLVQFGVNVGLGKAYNLAVEWAGRENATHLLLLDQDSVPDAGMVDALLTGFAAGERVAAAGPRWRDRQSGEDGFFVRFGRWSARRYRVPAAAVAPVDFLISSGSLLSLAALNDVGPFDEALFVDHTDTDWTLRARAKGYTLCGVGSAGLEHSFGETSIVIRGAGVRRRIAVHPPDRNYLLLRNSLLLWRRPYAPWPWILHDVRRVAAVMLFHVLFVRPRLVRLWFILAALREHFSTRSARRAGVPDLSAYDGRPPVARRSVEAAE
jgi:rhamnosyltransferase